MMAVPSIGARRKRFFTSILPIRIGRNNESYGLVIIKLPSENQHQLCEVIFYNLANDGIDLIAKSHLFPDAVFFDNFHFAFNIMS